MKTKICTKCNMEKSLIDFCINRTNKDNHNSSCKSCMNLYKKEFKKLYPWNQIWKNSKFRCENPKSKDYQWYGARGIKHLIIEEEIKELWFRDKAYLMQKPSINRKNNDRNYTFKNCRFIELSKNISCQDRTKQYKKVLQYDLQDNFIKEWKNSRYAGKSLKINRSNIIQCCRGNKKHKRAGAFIWKYKI